MFTRRKTRFSKVILALLVVSLSMADALDLSDFRKSKSGGGSNDDGDGLDIRALSSLPQMDEDMLSQSPTDLNSYVTDAKLVDSLYIVGPGDQFQVYIESAVLDKQVNAEGNVLLSKIGVIPVAGLTLREAKRAILEKVQAKKIKSQCFVNLGRPKTMKVFVTGAVNLPGIYQVSGNHRISDVINMAQGYSSLAQKAAISVTAQDGAKTEVDLRDFYAKGNLGANPYLTQGALVYVPFIDYQKPIVTIRKDSLLLTMQLGPEDNVDALLFKMNAYRVPPPFAAVKVTEKGGDPKILSPSESRQYRPSDSASIEVFPIKRDVYIGGAVQRPGFIMFRSNQKILQYISDAGLLISSRISNSITVYGADGTRKDLPVATGELKPGDMVFVGQNAEQKFINYTPILLSIASLTLAILTVMGR